MSQQRFRITTLVFTIALAFSLSASAAEWMVAAAAHTPGAAGTNWRTDLRIVNPGINAATATLYLLPQNTDNGGRPQHVALSIPALGQLALTDVVADKFAFSGSGALMVESSEAALVVTSRTYNEAPNGSTYGQFIPGVPSAEALKPGETANLIYLVKSDSYRSNLGFAGTTAARGSVFVTLYDGSGHSIGTQGFDVLPYGQTQVNDIFAALGAAPAAVARAEVYATTNVVVYSSVIDNRTGDPIAMIAQRDSDARSSLVIPAAAHAAGASNSAWRSDVRIFNSASGGSGDDNGGNASASVTVSFYPANVSTSAPQTRVLALGAHQVLAVDDIVQSTFGLAGATGALRFDSNQPLLITSRTYNQSAAGTFGQDIPSMALDRALTSGTVARFSGLTNRGYRTNLGFFNAGSSASDLQLELRGNGGASAGKKTLHLDPYTMMQINDVFTYLGVDGSVTTGALTLAATGGSVLSYASVIDNASGDPVYVPAVIGAPSPQQPSGSGGSGCVTVSRIAPGRKATYRLTGGLNYMTDTTWHSDGDTDATETTIAHTSPAESTIDTHYTFTVQNGLRLLTRGVSSATTTGGGFNILITTDSTFSSPLAVGPVSNWCSDTTWSIPAIDQTVIVGGTFPGSTTVLHRPATIGRVIATNETITVAGGTFQTVHYHGVQGLTDAKVQSTNIWLSIADGIFVKEEDFDANGNVQLTAELTNLQ
ncbi:MAG: hypothetical protein JWN02_1165 [Acidobacteria bacterium]|nr:hypothetical protein [Acidobacteriota bacterium]